MKTMGMITIVGLGPGDIRYMTMEAYEAIMGKNPVFLRTEQHPTVDTLKARGLVFQSYDGFYERFEDFDQVYEAIAKDVIERADEVGHVIYGVPGNPFVAERSVELIKAQSGDRQLKFIYGPSFIDATLTALGQDPVNGFAVLDALKLETSHVDTTKDLLVIQLYDNAVASQTKIHLAGYYGDDYPVTLVRGAGISGEEVIREIPMYMLDRTDIPDHLTSLFIPKMPEESGRKHFFEDLIRIMDRLRQPDGCPWDREQTHESLKQYLIEETYEVIDAIDNGDVDELIEELGDLILQVVFHAQIGKEIGYFDIHDVTDGISKKLIQRHPHVFGDTQVADSDEVLKNWEAIKLEEKEESVTDAMSRIPQSLPALMRAYKVQKKAAEVGFDWDRIEDAIEKVHEETREFSDALMDGNLEHASEELGDLLFAVVNVCRFLKVNPEFALTGTTKKFTSRFAYIENNVTKNGKKLEDMTLLELDDLWNEAKTKEK